MGGAVGAIHSGSAVTTEGAATGRATVAAIGVGACRAAGATGCAAGTADTAVTAVATAAAVAAVFAGVTGVGARSAGVPDTAIGPGAAVTGRAAIGAVTVRAVSG